MTTRLTTLLPAGLIWGVVGGTLGLTVPLALGVLPAASWLGAPLVAADPIRAVDAIVVLGVGAYDEKTLTPGSAYRLVRGVQLLKEGHGRLLIVSGGSHRGTTSSDAAVMARVARVLEVASGSLIVDEAPASTWQQALSVTRIARDRGLQSIALVTSPLESYRAARTFRRAGLDVVSVPVAPSVDARLLTVGEDHLAGRLSAVARALYEYVAIAAYRLQGRL